MAAAIAVAGAAACSGGTEPSWCDAPPGVPVVVASSEGSWASRGSQPRLDELWRAGGLREGEELVYPLGASASAGGRLAIADFSLREVVVIEPDGGWSGAWGRQGQGPGELSTPIAVNWDDSTGDLVVFDFGRAAVVYLRDGTPARAEVPVDADVLAPILAAGELGWAGVRPDGGVLLAPAPSRERDQPATRETLVIQLAPRSSSADTLISAVTRLVGGPPPYATLPAPGWPRLTVSVGTRGELAIGGLDGRYRVTVRGEDGALRHVVCRAVEPRPLSEREFEAPEGGEHATEMEARVRAAPPPDSLAPYGRLLLGARGRLWVQRERPATLRFGEHLLGVPGASWDVFDPAGDFLGTVETAPGTRLQAAAGDTIWAYEQGELDETWVVAYRLRLEPH